MIFIFWNLPLSVKAQKKKIVTKKKRKKSNDGFTLLKENLWMQVLCYSFRHAAAAAGASAAWEDARRMLQELSSAPSSQSVFILPPVNTCCCPCSRCEPLREDVLCMYCCTPELEHDTHTEGESMTVVSTMQNAYMSYLFTICRIAAGRTLFVCTLGCILNPAFDCMIAK